MAGFQKNTIAIFIFNLPYHIYILLVKPTVTPLETLLLLQMYTVMHSSNSISYLMHFLALQDTAFEPFFFLLLKEFSFLSSSCLANCSSLTSLAKLRVLYVPLNQSPVGSLISAILTMYFVSPDAVSLLSVLIFR